MPQAFACLLAVVGLCWAAFSASTHSQAADPELLAEPMLTALGGRAAWARLTNTVNDSQQNRLTEPAVVRSMITMDFTRPRFRIETTGPGLHLIRVVDGERHWRLTREGTIEPVPANVLEEDRRWYAGHVYRTLHRIAARDRALTLAAGRDGRLDVHEAGARIAWFALDVRGEPYAFGAHQDDVGSISGPWDFEQNGIRHPVWVSRPDGSWRAMVKGLKINVPLNDKLFAQPDAARERRKSAWPVSNPGNEPSLQWPMTPRP
jgi:hypothetical protein